MKRTLLTAFAVLVIAGLAGTVWTLRRHSHEMEQKYTATKAAEDSLRTRFDTALASIAEIQDSLAAVLPSESNVLQMSQDVEKSGTLTSSRKNQVLRNISDLNESIQKSKNMIQQLEQKLTESNMKVAALEKIVSNLKKTVEDRERMVANLTQHVESLKVQVATLQTDVEVGRQQITAQQTVIEDKRRELSTVYYLVSTKKQLKSLGVIQESGGVAGLGRSARLSGTFPERVFDRIDTDLQTKILVQGRKPKILSGQNSSSYQLVPLDMDETELRITNPQEFRKVRYLVIQVS